MYIHGLYYNIYFPSDFYVGNNPELQEGDEIRIKPLRNTNQYNADPTFKLQFCVKNSTRVFVLKFTE